MKIVIDGQVRSVCNFGHPAERLNVVAHRGSGCLACARERATAQRESRDFDPDRADERLLAISPELHAQLRAIRSHPIFASEGCLVQGCSNPRHAMGYCGMHRQRLSRTGNPTAVRRETTLNSFWKRVDKSGDCWEWRGFILASGYGQIASRIRPTKSRSRLAHRVAYELVIGDIPEGMVLDHLCRNRTCVNPAHLEPVTQEENVRRGLKGVLNPARQAHYKAMKRHALA